MDGKDIEQGLDDSESRDVDLIQEISGRSYLPAPPVSGSVVVNDFAPPKNDYGPPVGQLTFPEPNTLPRSRLQVNTNLGGDHLQGRQDGSPRDLPIASHATSRFDVLNLFPESIAKLFPMTSRDNRVATPDQESELQRRLTLDLTEWIEEFGTRNILYYEGDEKDEQVINIATLQRINLCRQQAFLIDYTKNIMRLSSYGYTEDWRRNELRSHLEHYVTAVRDYKYMKEAAAEARDLNQEDPFLITSRSSFGRKLITDMTLYLNYDASKRRFKRLPEDFGRPQLPGRLRNRDVTRQQHNAFVGRLVSALVGGIALVGPMLLMLLHKTFVTSLVTVSVCVFVFAFCMAYFSHDSMPRDIMVAVAGYAAVLVVFVGTSGTAS